MQLRPAVVPFRRSWLVAAMLGVIVFAVYGRTLGFPFVFDDVPAIAENATLRSWPTAFFPPADTTASGRPVLNISFALNYALSGATPGSYRAVNLVIHLAAGCLLFGIIRRTLAALGERNDAVAFGIAVLWMLHPLQTESVTYVVQRAESLMGFFYLLTLYAFVRGARAVGGGSGGWFVVAIVACLLGMGTKEVMVSAPLIVLLYDRTFLAGGFRAAWQLRGRIHLAFAATWLPLLALVLATKTRSGTSGFGIGVSWWQYAATQPFAIVRYLWLAVWPHPLVFDYGTQWTTERWESVFSAVVVVALLGATAWWVTRPLPSRRALGFAAVWFWAILAPTSLIPGNRQTAAEHRMYLALAPLVAVAIIGLGRRMPRAILAATIIGALALATLTARRNADYRSLLALWADTVAKVPANAHARVNYANALAALPEQHGAAIDQLVQAVQLDPTLAEAHNNLANLWAATSGHRTAAIAEYHAALAINPALAEAHNNLANALNAENRFAEAVEHYEAALRLKPDYAAAHFNLAVTLLNLPHRGRDALAHAEAAARLQPDFAGARELAAELRSAAP